ncbi:PUA-like domain-containing protein [Suillus occidentalis]|nr:PUA-like domain-containing protein [Suillus occidentalis]
MGSNDTIEQCQHIIEEFCSSSGEEIEAIQDRITSGEEKNMVEDQNKIVSEEDKEIEEDPEVTASEEDEEIEKDRKKVARKVTKEVRVSRARMLRHFGEIPGKPVGSTWRTREDCYESGVHRHPKAGIQGSKISGACSIVVSGQYDDDTDLGDTIFYVGAGGGIPNTDGWPKRPGPQVSDQTWSDWGNEALRRSCDTGKPVRVVRSWKCVSDFAPYVGYRYDGLYKVRHACREKNRDGFYICRYNIEASQPPLPRRSRFGNAIEPSWSSPASVATSDTAVLPSGTPTSHKRNACFDDDQLIHVNARYTRRKMPDQVAYENDEE